MRTVLLFAFVTASLIACGNKTVKNPEAPTPQATDTDNVKSAIDTVSAQTDTSGLQEEKPQGVQRFKTRCFIIPKEILDSMKRVKHLRESLANAVVDTVNNINCEQTDSIN